MRIDKTNLIVLLSALCLTILVIALLWDMNFFPADADAYYLPAAGRMPVVQYLSQLHDGFDYKYHTWLHGKEAMIALFYFLQQTLKDYQTLRPLIVLFVSTFFCSAALLFFIAKSYWGKRIGFICYLFCVSCLWPYLYILFPKHQPLGMFFFLFAVWLLIVFRKKLSLAGYFLSGFFLCVMVYSSPASFAYIPFYITAVGAEFFLITKKSPQPFAQSRWLFLLGGFLIAFLYFNAPHIIHNIKQYIVYINTSASQNHLYHNQHILQQWMPGQPVPTRGNILWVITYFFLVMPILFPCAIACLIYLLARVLQEKSLQIKILILGTLVLSLSPVLVAETKGVSQYGANYFPSFVGILFLIGVSLHDFLKNIYPGLHKMQKKIFFYAAGAVVVLHIGINGYFLATDIIPSRLATTYISKTLKDMNIKTIYAHDLYPLRAYILQHLNPSTAKTITIKPIKSIVQPRQGCIFLMPITTRSILSAYGTYKDFDKDIYLNEIIRKGTLDKYTTHKFKTVTSSKFWAQEEEILSWMDLTKNLITDQDFKKGYIRLLSAEKIQQDRQKNTPCKAYLESVFGVIRAIGTRQSLYAYKGEYVKIETEKKLDKIKRNIRKIGNPTDSLIAYVYRTSPSPIPIMFNIFTPYAQTFSRPVKAINIPRDSQEEELSFAFDPPITLEPFFYYFIGICRTGPLNDTDFYQILLNKENLSSEDAEYIDTAAKALNIDNLP